LGRIQLVDLDTSEQKSAQVSGPYHCSASHALRLFAVASYGDKCAFLCRFDTLDVAFIVKHSHGVYSVSFAHHKPLLASADGAGVVKITDVKLRNLVYSIQLHTSLVGCVRFSPNDEYILTASSDTNAAVIPLSNIHSLVPLRGHTSAVSCITMLSDMATVMTGSAGMLSSSVVCCFESMLFRSDSFRFVLDAS
jgi:WD40 repeat protein